jgi:hypothetical protein
VFSCSNCIRYVTWHMCVSVKWPQCIFLYLFCLSPLEHCLLKRFFINSCKYLTSLAAQCIYELRLLFCTRWQNMRNHVIFFMVIVIIMVRRMKFNAAIITFQVSMWGFEHQIRLLSIVFSQDWPSIWKLEHQKEQPRQFKKALIWFQS